MCTFEVIHINRAYLNKYSTGWYVDPSDPWTTPPAQMGFGLGMPLAAVSIAGLIAGGRLNRKLKDTPKIHKGHIARMKQRRGLEDVPVVSYPGFGNAAYVPAGFERMAISEIEGVNPAGSERMYQELQKEMGADTIEEAVKKLRNNRKGLMVYDPEFSTTGVMGHEMGHAEIDREGGLGGFSQKWLSGLAPILGAVGGGSLGRYIQQEHGFKWAPQIGLAAGGTLGMMPLLASEAGATRRAVEDMERSSMTEESKKKNQGALRTAFSTYLTASMLPVAAGAFSALYFKLMEHSGKAEFRR